MPIAEYPSRQESFELPNGFTLQRAENEEFGRAWVVYRRLNADFAQSFAGMAADLSGVDNCFWIIRQGRRLGGVIMEPNKISDFFLIPPQSNPRAILAVLMPLLSHWSAPDKAIRAQAIASAHVSAFQQAGFSSLGSRLWLIRPTELWTVSWPAAWRVTTLDPGQPEPVAALFAEAFAGGVGPAGQRDFAAHLAVVEQYFAGYVAGSDCGRASSMVLEQETGRLAGVCLMGMHKHLPTVRYVAVAPPFQRRGLATRLLMRATSQLARNHGWVKAEVIAANPALNVFHHLGFTSGDPLHELEKPAAS